MIQLFFMTKFFLTSPRVCDFAGRCCLGRIHRFLGAEEHRNISGASLAPDGLCDSSWDSTSLTYRAVTSSDTDRQRMHFHVSIYGKLL